MSNSPESTASPVRTASPPDPPPRASSESERSAGRHRRSSGKSAAESPARAWERHAVFRETFLLHVPPASLPALRALDQAIFATTLELEDLTLQPSPWVHMSLRAVAADLGFLQHFLESLAEDRFHASFDEAEGRLAERAESWALKLRQIAARMEEATAPDDTGGTESRP